MLFTSLVFAVFLPLVFVGYWLINYPTDEKPESSIRLWLQNLFIVIASYVFYGWWDWMFLFLICFTSLWAYASGMLLVRSGNEAARKLIVAMALVVNLGILGVFKYYNFFVDSIVICLNAIGVSAHPSSLTIILPVGISFYTFQALSYVIDVYRRDIEPTKDVVAFLAFVSFFPQLVAGPIERATNLLPQFLNPRRFDYALAVEGCRQALWGFFKKLVVADGCAFTANKILDNEVNSSISILVGLICFAMQIYGDFSGYSDIAIGISKTFGIRLKRNFNIPYFSRNIGEFWRRWHISLTTWFKDYLYIPLGGSRAGLAKTIRNTFIIFLVSGFWHGASWTFIIWGLVHAIAFMPSIIMKTNRKYVDKRLDELPTILGFREAISMGLTFFIVVIGWSFFRAETVSQAFNWIQLIITGFDFSLAPLSHQGAPHAILWSSIMMIVEWLNRRCGFGCAIFPSNSALRYMCYVIMVLVMAANLSPRQAFIYFQF